MLTANELADHIKRIAVERGVTIKTLAIEMDVFPSHLSMMMSNDRGYNQKVLDYLGMEEVVGYRPRKVITES